MVSGMEKTEIKQEEIMVLKIRRDFGLDIANASSSYSNNGTNVPASLLAGIIVAESRGNRNLHKYKPALHKTLLGDNLKGFVPDIILASYSHGAAQIDGFHAKGMSHLGKSCGLLPYSIPAFYHKPAHVLAAYLTQLKSTADFLYKEQYDTVVRIFKGGHQDVRNNIVDEFIDEAIKYMTLFERSLNAVTNVNEYIKENNLII